MSYEFYPDADPETTSVDGEVRRIVSPGNPWADVHDGDGTEAIDDSPLRFIYIAGGELTNTWRRIERCISLFDTSSLPDDLTINNASLFVWIERFADSLEIGDTFAINVYSSNPASNTELIAADYGTLGTTAYSSNFYYDSLPGSAVGDGVYHEFVLNATGIAAINKTGITKFGLREATYDAANSAPAWKSNLGTGAGIGQVEKGTHKPLLKINFPSAVGDPGYIWVEGTQLHWLDYGGNERSYEGTDTGTNSTVSYFWVEGTYLHYTDSNGDERRKEGTAEGATGVTAGFWIEGTDLHYIDANGDERYIEGV